MPATTQCIPGFFTRAHRFEVPLDHADPKGRTITVFAREVTTRENEGKDLPWMVYMQGGPGFPSPRPRVDGHTALSRGVKEYRVLLLDQRGTGLSSRISFESLAAMSSPKAQAKYLSHFRADSIVKDAEIIRRKLLGKDKKWTVLGQSFGGFVATSYLSLAPEGLDAALMTGGIPPVGATAEDVYRKTYRRVASKNRLFYERYPEDAERVRRVADFVKRNKVTLPCGDRLSVNRLRQLGMAFGGSSGFDSVHFLLEGAFDLIGRGEQVSYHFRKGVEGALGFDAAPLYSLLHEPCYCDGSSSKWAAERVLEEFPEFEDSPQQPLFFFGEMIYPWMFSEYRALKPLKAAAEILADWERWPALYDKTVLAQNSVPAAAAMYFDDMYVDRELSEAAASGIKGLKVWVTNQFEHDGVRAGGDEVLGRLIDMIRGNVEFHYSAPAPCT